MALKHIAVGVGALAVVAGGTGYSLAATSHSNGGALPAASTPSSSSSGSASSAPGKDNKQGKDGKHGKGGLRLKLAGLQHAEWVTKDAKTSKDVTHDAVSGSVSAVSGSSITVKASDGFSETFVVSSSTKVHTEGSKDKAQISSVKVGDQALVAGTKSGATVSATEVVDRGK